MIIIHCIYIRSIMITNKYVNIQKFRMNFIHCGKAGEGVEEKEGLEVEKRWKKRISSRRRGWSNRRSWIWTWTWSRTV